MHCRGTNTFNFTFFMSWKHTLRLYFCGVWLQAWPTPSPAISADSNINVHHLIFLFIYWSRQDIVSSCVSVAVHIMNPTTSHVLLSNKIKWTLLFCVFTGMGNSIKAQVWGVYACLHNWTMSHYIAKSNANMYLNFCLCIDKSNT